MGEIQSLITRTKRDGEVEGLYLTPRDIDFVKFAAKWWCVSADHYIRYSTPKTEWERVYLLGEHQEWRKSRYHAIMRRMSRLSKLDSYSPLYAARVDKQRTAYWCTPSGGDLIGAPWTKYPSGNTTRAAHAWMACDVGTELERLGYTIYSEREFANGHTVDSDVVAGGKFLNPIEDSKSPNKDHGMRPDLAIAGSDDRFIFIEIERETGQSPAKYRNKLLNYYMHDRVAAVWYVTDKMDTAKRIKRVHSELKDESREMPVRLLKAETAFHDYTYTKGLGSAGCVQDLRLIGATTGELTNG